MSTMVDIYMYISMVDIASGLQVRQFQVLFDNNDTEEETYSRFVYYKVYKSINYILT